MRASWIVLLAALPSTLLIADTFGSPFSGYSIVPVFQNNVNSPGNPLIPVSFGGLTLNPSNPEQLIIGGNAEGSGAAFYSIAVTRGVDGHISGLVGQPSLFLSAPRLSAGASFGPSFNAGEVLFHSIASGGGGVDVAMTRWGTTGPTKTVNIVPENLGGLGFVPVGFGGVGELKVLTYSGKFYAVTVQTDADGTYDLTGAQLKATLPGSGMQGFVYVKGGSPGFAVDSLLVAEYTTGLLVAYDVDATGNPLPATRRVFLSDPPFSRPSGMFVDPRNGDVLVSTQNNSRSGIYRIKGFVLPVSIPVSSCQSITAPGYYHLTSDLLAPAGEGVCVAIRDTSNTHLDCLNHGISGSFQGLTVSNVNGFSVTNCRLQANVALVITGSSRGLVSSNLVGISAQPYSEVKIDNSSALNLVSNTHYGSIHTTASNHLVIRFNRIVSRDRAGLITAAAGSWNTIDANWADAVDPVDAEVVYGIQILDEAHDIISNNTALNAKWDLIYTEGASGGFVTRNRVSRGAFGFSGLNNTDMVWRDNYAELVSAPFYLKGMLRNQIIRNLARNYDVARFISVASPQGQNVLKQNDFGHVVDYRGFNLDFEQHPPPPGAFIDGGGNICVLPAGVQTIVCH